MNVSNILPLVLLLVAIPDLALAYVGPGAGLSAIGTLLSLIGAVLLAAVGFIWYPVKRLMKSRRAAAAEIPASVDPDE